MAFYLFAAGQPLSNNNIVNLDKGITKIENIAFRSEFNSNNLNKKINLIKDKLFAHSLAN